MVESGPLDCIMCLGLALASSWRLKLLGGLPSPLWEAHSIANPCTLGAVPS